MKLTSFIKSHPIFLLFIFIVYSAYKIRIINCTLSTHLLSVSLVLHQVTAARHSSSSVGTKQMQAQNFTYESLL